MKFLLSQGCRDVPQTSLPKPLARAEFPTGAAATDSYIKITEIVTDVDFTDAYQVF